ncbi:MAG: DUF4173 domain-containing protein [Oscillospiraceae bacterium]|nr:DUF4173 domain-containing protein [Oscillospiraceae bacterium]
METANNRFKYKTVITVILLFLCTYSIIRTGKMYGTSLGTIISSLAFMACCIYYLKINQVHLNISFVPLLIFSIAFIVSVFLNGNVMIRRFALVISIAIFLFALCKGTYGYQSQTGNDNIPADLVQCFIYGIDTERLTKISRSNQYGKLTSKLFPQFMKILLGLLLSSPVFIFALSMLSYDSSFNELLNNIFTFDIDEIFEETWLIICTVPVFIYIYLGIGSCTCSSSNKRFDNSFFAKIKSSLSWLSSETLIAMVLPVLALYAVFFVSQWDYYTLAFHGVIPAGYSYAEYAREGFFQLFAVSAVNLLMMLGCTWFSKLRSHGSEIVLKIITISISIFSLILILTAASKMYLYILEYGLTPLRVYSSWAMIVLATIFILFIAKQINNKIPLYSLCILCTAILFLALCISDPDTKIASYNTSKFIAGDLESVDIDLLNDLGDSAVPSLINLYDYYYGLPEEQQNKMIEQHAILPEKINIEELRTIYCSSSAYTWDWSRFTMPYLMAKKAVNAHA